MKKLLLLLIFIPSIVIADDSSSKFYEPSDSNAYQGRLFYDSTKEDYPIDKMIKFCEPYTGIDTAQIKCKKQSKQSVMICEYKCSLYWSASSK